MFPEDGNSTATCIMTWNFSVKFYQISKSKSPARANHQQEQITKIQDMNRPSDSDSLD
jgi:hypothetical protein